VSERVKILVLVGECKSVIKVLILLCLVNDLWLIRYSIIVVLFWYIYDIIIVKYYEIIIDD